MNTGSIPVPLPWEESGLRNGRFPPLGNDLGETGVHDDAGFFLETYILRCNRVTKAKIPAPNKLGMPTGKKKAMAAMASPIRSKG